MWSVGDPGLSLDAASKGSVELPRRRSPRRSSAPVAMRVFHAVSAGRCLIASLTSWSFMVGSAGVGRQCCCGCEVGVRKHVARVRVPHAECFTRGNGHLVLAWFS